MKIWVESCAHARLFKPTQPTIAIRIFDPGARPFPRAFDGGWDNCLQAPWDSDAYLYNLYYTFADWDLDTPAWDREAVLKDCQSRPFTSTIAEHLLRSFSQKYREASALLIHCNAGLSRSPAIAVALRDIFQFPVEWQGRAQRLKDCVAGQDYIGNQYVYRLLIEAATKLNLWKD